MALSMSQVPALFGMGAGTFSREANGPCWQFFSLYDSIENAYLAQPAGSPAESVMKQSLDKAGADLRNCRAGKAHQDWLNSKAASGPAQQGAPLPNYLYTDQPAQPSAPSPFWVQPTPQGAPLPNYLYTDQPAQPSAMDKFLSQIGWGSKPSVPSGSTPTAAPKPSAPKQPAAQPAMSAQAQIAAIRAAQAAAKASHMNVGTGAYPQAMTEPQQLQIVLAAQAAPVKKLGTGAIVAIVGLGAVALLSLGAITFGRR